MGDRSRFRGGKDSMSFGLGIDGVLTVIGFVMVLFLAVGNIGAVLNDLCAQVR